MNKLIFQDAKLRNNSGGSNLDLANFQLKLSNHYSALRDLRTTENYPVYAIEHGLTADECLSAQKLLNESLRAERYPDRAFWLVWIAIAAEIGYRYDGTEYWESFASAFPDWCRFGDRNKIRAWYKRFAEEYKGLAPLGLWARQFPIIAWPITQAILPKYLQRHFVNHLFDLRHVLGRSGELTLDEIGDLLNERYYGGSSRFEGFLQQKALASRIVMALGMEDIEDAISPVEKVTLNRIVEDVEKLGNYGARLKETRQILRDARFINSSKHGFVQKQKQTSNTQKNFAEQTEQPKLLARQTDIATWSLFLAIPNMANPLRQVGLMPRDLEQARMRFRLNREGSTWSPGRALFSYNGQNEEPLQAYSNVDYQVLIFDNPLPSIQNLLQKRLVFPAQNLRLLKIRADGTAFELFGQCIRTDHSYLLVSSMPVESNAIQKLGLLPLQSNALSACLYRLDVPKTLNAEQIKALCSLGLGYQLGVRMEPLGLSPRWSITDGILTFLDTETVMFCISSDVNVKEFLVTTNSVSATRIMPTAGGSTLISLGTLPIGLHQIGVSALGAASGGDITAEDMIIEVRAATPWQQAIEGKAGVGLRLDPHGASIEQFLDGTARICLVAPQRRMVKLIARFYDVDGALFHEENLGSYNSPILDDKLSMNIVQRFMADAQLENVERATRIEILVCLDEYGTAKVIFEKDSEPLRWLRIDGKNVRLSDDTEDDLPPKIERFDLDSIETPAAVDYQQALTGIELKGKGGLLVASLNGRHYEVVVTPAKRQFDGFSDLGIPVSISKTQKPQILINALERWYNTRRLMGPMAFLARSNAIRTLESALAASLCGKDWVAATDKVLTGKQSIGDLYAIIYYSRGFASGIANYNWQYEDDESGANAEFIRLINVYKIPSDPTLAALALKLAFKPHTIFDMALPESFDLLKKSQPIIRGAYFARLSSELKAKDIQSEVA